MLAHGITHEIRSRLERAFGSRLRDVILYGSAARGDDRPDSDIDLMLILSGAVNVWQDISTAVDALYSLQLEIDRPIHVLPVSEASYTRGDFAVHRNAVAEGMRI